MNLKKLNEQLQKILEISYETKKSYLAKRQAQFDAMQDRLNKAKRLVRDTENQKEGKRKLSDEKLENLVSMVANELKKYTGYNFYMKRWGNTNEWILEKGDYYNEWSDSFHFSFSTDDKYLNIFCGGTDNQGKKRSQDIKISLDDFNPYKLNIKTVKELKSFIKSFDNQKENKYTAKIKKVINDIKNTLSKFKQNNYGNFSEYRIEEYSKHYPKFVAIKNIPIPHKEGFELDYNVKAVCLNKDLDVIIVYKTEKYSRLSTDLLENCKTEPKYLYEACVKILNALKEQNPTGRSNIKNQQKRLDELKAQAESAIGHFKNKMKKAATWDEIDDIEETRNSYEFTIHYWGDWEGEEYDFQRPTQKSYENLEKICNELTKEYPDLKFSYGVSEKHMITCSVNWS